MQASFSFLELWLMRVSFFYNGVVAMWSKHTTPTQHRSVALFAACLALSSCDAMMPGSNDDSGMSLAPSPMPATVPEVPPNAALQEARQQFAAGAFGNAARYYEIATKFDPGSRSGWLGLAASYDRLRRFDLADDAYAEAEKVVGHRAEFFNNRGYSYLLRGDFNRAAKDLYRARDLAPESEAVRNNLALLRYAQTN